MYILFQVILLLCSIAGYYFSPNTYSLALCIIAFVLYAISFITLVVNKQEKNYFTFEIIFSISYFFVFYAFPIIASPLGRYHFIFPYNEQVITKATFLSTVGYIAFAIGNSYKNKIKTHIKLSSKKLSNSDFTVDSRKLSLPVFLCSVVLLLTFLQFYVFHANRYEAMETGVSINGIWSYINVFEHGIIMSSIALTFFYLYKNTDKHIDKKIIAIWVLVGLTVALSFFAGYRATPMGYIIAIVAGWVVYKGGMSSIKLFLLSILGFVLMNMIMLFRSNNLSMFSFDIISLASDLITNNYTLYRGYDYVQNNGLVFFPFIGPLITAVPFLLGIVMNVFKIPSYYSSTASFITNDVIGNLKLGMGSNVIISIYLSLGFLGVPICMFYFGKYINYISNNVKSVGPYRLLLYFEAMAVAVYMARSDLFYSVSHIIWGCIFLYIFLKIAIKPMNR